MPDAIVERDHVSRRGFSYKSGYLVDIQSYIILHAFVALLDPDVFADVGVQRGSMRSRDDAQGARVRLQWLQVESELDPSTVEMTRVGMPFRPVPEECVAVCVHPDHFRFHELFRLPVKPRILQERTKEG